MKYVLSTFDGSSRSRDVVTQAARGAVEQRARLHVLWIVPPCTHGLDIALDDTLLAGQIDLAHAQMLALQASLTPVCTATQLTMALRVGETADATVAYALEHGIREVYVAAGRSPLWHFSAPARIAHALAARGCAIVLVGRSHGRSLCQPGVIG